MPSIKFCSHTCANLWTRVQNSRRVPVVPVSVPHQFVFPSEATEGSDPVERNLLSPALPPAARMTLEKFAAILLERYPPQTQSVGNHGDGAEAHRRARQHGA